MAVKRAELCQGDQLSFPPSVASSIKGAEARVVRIPSSGQNEQDASVAAALTVPFQGCPPDGLNQLIASSNCDVLLLMF